MNRKNILITGASSGLGYTMAKMYAEQGKNLALCARRTEKLEQLKQEIASLDPSVKVSIKALDVNDHDKVFEVFNEFIDEFGHLDRIIVNAGMGKGASLGTGYFEANKQTAITNFVSAIAQCEAAMAHFLERGEGHLVMISSVSSVRGARRALNVYAATKAAVSSLMEGLQVELLDSRIKVTTINPGFIRSEINEKVKKVPFIVDTQTGCRAILKAIEKEGRSYFVPAWPWALVARILKIAPLGLLRKLS